MKALKHLLDHATVSFLEPKLVTAKPCDSRLGAELLELLTARNGAFFFSQSLRLFSTDDCLESYGLHRWNSNDLWRSTYESIPSSLLFFAEDLFGYQFGILDDDIVRFDPETAELAYFASSIDGFANAILEDTDYLTGMSIATAWQSKLGSIHLRNRLIPQVPFVLGGEFDLSNLRSVESAKAMRIRGPIASKIRHLPDGTQITFVIEE
jgi:hypothetical protein